MHAAINEGIAYAGIRTLDLVGSPGPFVWYDLTDGDPAGSYPADACSSSINLIGESDLASIRVMTTTGEVFETQCDVDPLGPALTCDEIWTQLVTPVPGADGMAAAQRSGAAPKRS